MKSVLNYDSSCQSGSFFFSFPFFHPDVKLPDVLFFFFFLACIFQACQRRKGPLCERLQFVFCLRASANGPSLHSGVVDSVPLIPCKLSYLCSAPETYKITQQMRGLLVFWQESQAASSSCELTSSLRWAGGWPVGRPGQDGTRTDGINVLFCFEVCRFINMPLSIPVQLFLHPQSSDIFTIMQVTQTKQSTFRQSFTLVLSSLNAQSKRP